MESLTHEQLRNWSEILLYENGELRRTLAVLKAKIQYLEASQPGSSTSVTDNNICQRQMYGQHEKVQRLANDQSILPSTSYEGSHIHPLPAAAVAMASTSSATPGIVLSGPSMSNDRGKGSGTDLTPNSTRGSDQMDQLRDTGAMLGAIQSPSYAAPRPTPGPGPIYVTPGVGQPGVLQHGQQDSRPGPPQLQPDSLTSALLDENFVSALAAKLCANVNFTALLDENFVSAVAAKLSADSNFTSALAEKIHIKVLSHLQQHGQQDSRLGPPQLQPDSLTSALLDENFVSALAAKLCANVNFTALLDENFVSGVAAKLSADSNFTSALAEKIHIKVLSYLQQVSCAERGEDV